MAEKKDLEAIIYMHILGLKEEKNKKYSGIACDQNITYIFANRDEFENYFIMNGYTNLDEEVLKLCIIRTTKKGSIIALKGLCDHTISWHQLLNFGR